MARPGHRSRVKVRQIPRDREVVTGVTQGFTNPQLRSPLSPRNLTTTPATATQTPRNRAASSTRRWHGPDRDRSAAPRTAVAGRLGRGREVEYWSPHSLRIAAGDAQLLMLLCAEGEVPLIPHLDWP